MGFGFGIVKLHTRSGSHFNSPQRCAARAAVCTSAAFEIGVPSTRRCAGMLSFVIHQRARLTQYSYCHQARSWSRDGGMGGGGIRENNNDGSNREDTIGGWLRPS